MELSVACRALQNFRRAALGSFRADSLAGVATRWLFLGIDAAIDELVHLSGQAYHATQRSSCGHAAAGNKGHAQIPRYQRSLMNTQQEIYEALGKFRAGRLGAPVR